MNHATVRQASSDDLDSISQLLESASLPTLGVKEHLQHFLVAEEQGIIVGAIGLEVYGETALLRSAVVASGRQNEGIGTQLYNRNIEEARRLGVRRLLLLTNTAEEYFARKGFQKIEQKSVTGPVTTSFEFSGACPAHAACMELMLSPSTSILVLCTGNSCRSQMAEGFLKSFVVIFDTAPTGHTIRLLELPVDWSKHIEESAKGGGNTCIGPVASIQENKKKYDEATRLLGDPQRTTFIFVLQPEATSLFETRRSSEELTTIGVKKIELIVNGILPKEVCEHPFFTKRYEMQQKHLAEITTLFPVEQRRMLQRDGEIKGFGAIRNIARDLFTPKARDGSYRLQGSDRAATADQAPLVADNILDVMRPDGQTKAIFFTGKGGVGKTTVSCAAAFQLASEGYRTLLLTTDPASHIGEVLSQHVGDTIQPVNGVKNLVATIIDQRKATEEYKERILKDAKAKYSADMLIAIKEELESPCTEEMAAFDKFMHYVESDEFDVVVFDTAPTGHTRPLRFTQREQSPHPAFIPRPSR